MFKAEALDKEKDRTITSYVSTQNFYPDFKKSRLVYDTGSNNNILKEARKDSDIYQQYLAIIANDFIMTSHRNNASYFIKRLNYMFPVKKMGYKKHNGVLYKIYDNRKNPLTTIDKMIVFMAPFSLDKRDYDDYFVMDRIGQFDSNWITSQMTESTIFLKIVDFNLSNGSHFVNTKNYKRYEKDIQETIDIVKSDNKLTKNDVILYGINEGATGAVVHGALGNYKAIAINPLLDETRIDLENDFYFLKNFREPDLRRKIKDAIVDNDNNIYIIVNKNLNENFEQASTLFTEQIKVLNLGGNGISSGNDLFRSTIKEQIELINILLYSEDIKGLPEKFENSIIDIKPIVKVTAEYVTKEYELAPKKSDKVKSIIFQNKFPKFWAVRGISFEAYEGETIAVVGTNGSGKSTLMKMISGIVTPTTGTIAINGETSLIAINAGLRGNLSGRDNIRLKALMIGMTNDEINLKMNDIISFSELGEFIDQPVKSYSSGMKSKLGFAISVHTNPDILIIDEALSVGDATFNRKSLDKIKEFQRNGKTIFFVSHSLRQIREMADKVLWIHYGQVRMFDRTTKVMNEYDKFVSEYKKMPDYQQKEYRQNYRNEQKNFTIETLYENELRKKDISSDNEVLYKKITHAENSTRLRFSDKVLIIFLLLLLIGIGGKILLDSQIILSIFNM